MDVDRAARLVIDRRDVLLERGLVRLALGRAAEAMIDLDRYVASGAATVEALEARARLHLEAGRVADARADYDAAIALRPTPELVLARGRIDEGQT